MKTEQKGHIFEGQPSFIVYEYRYLFVVMILCNAANHTEDIERKHHWSKYMAQNNRKSATSLKW